MRAFVTGGSGFVGRNLIDGLRSHDNEVYALARSPEAAEIVQRHGATAVLGGLDDQDALAQGMKDCDVVFHAAAIVHDWGDFQTLYRANVKGTANALAAAREAAVPRFVHVSTEAVLLDGGPLVQVDESVPIPERSIGLYPLTKARAEKLVIAANGPDFATVVVRPRLVWGVGDTSVLPEFVDAVRSGRFMWFGGGHHLTSTCHVANVVEGLLLAGERGEPGATYFLSDGEPIMMRSFLTGLLATQGLAPGRRSMPYGLARNLAKACELLWRRLPLRGSPPITRVTANLVGQEITVNDEKARRELGYRGFKSRQAGLDEMAAAAAK